MHIRLLYKLKNVLGREAQGGCIERNLCRFEGESWDSLLKAFLECKLEFFPFSLSFSSLSLSSFLQLLVPEGRNLIIRTVSNLQSYARLGISSLLCKVVAMDVRCDSPPSYSYPFQSVCPRGRSLEPCGGIISYCLSFSRNWSILFHLSLQLMANNDCSNLEEIPLVLKL